MDPRKSLDTLLSRAVGRGDVPGVIAVAGTAEGVTYEGAAGKRALNGPAEMAIDTVTWLASMTKALTAAAAMQLVERGKLSLDRPAADVLPELGEVQVLEGFDASGEPKLRPPKGTVTLRNLLTHSAGFAYEIWNGNVGRWLESRRIPGIITGARATFERPLVGDPDRSWNYGPGIDYAGRMVEEASGERLGEYARKNLFEPLGMLSTAFRITSSQRTRLAGMHARLPDGGLAPYPFEIPQDAECDMGGHAAYGTAPDYLRFLRMILNGGALDGVRVLEAETVAAMSKNQMGALDVRALGTAMPPFSNDVEFYPGIPCKWGLSFMINTARTSEGRSAGSLSWAGLCNSYYWADPTRKIAGLLITQILPFFDARAVELFREFETTVYRTAR